MQITIDQNAINEAVQATATRAVTDGLGSYEVTAAIANAVTAQVADGAISQAIAAAVTKIDVDALTQAIAEELQRATIRATSEILQEGMLDTICKLRGIKDYDSEYQRKRLAIKAQVFGGTR